MSSGYWPTTIDVYRIFSEETANAGGTVTDTFDDGNRLFIRSVVPDLCEIIPGDSVKGGVALRSNLEEIWIHPYMLRVVCRNGSLRPLAIQSTRITRKETSKPPRAEHDFVHHMREAIRRCLDKEALQAGVNEMREARSKGIESALRMLQITEFLHANLSSPRLLKIAPILIEEAVKRSEGKTNPPSRNLVLQRHCRKKDRTVFGLMNAVTSVARDSKDPEERWRLEELGGMIPLLPHPFEKLAREHTRPPRTARRIIPDPTPIHLDEEELATPGPARKGFL
jgi:hypothetical protein